MTCSLTVTLISEHQMGDCGNEWKYDLEAKVFNQGLKGEGVISVPKHTLAVGALKKPFGLPAPLILSAGECTGDLLIKVKLTATEVDQFVNDVGKTSMEFRLDSPGANGGSVTRELEISAGVREAPGIRNLNSVFTLKVRFDLVCE